MIHTISTGCSDIWWKIWGHGEEIAIMGQFIIVSHFWPKIVILPVKCASIPFPELLNICYK